MERKTNGEIEKEREKEKEGRKQRKGKREEEKGREVEKTDRKESLLAPRPGRSNGLSLKFNLNQRNKEDNTIQSIYERISRRNNCSRNMAVCVVS